MRQNVYFVLLLLFLFILGCQQSKQIEKSHKNNILLVKPTPLIEAELLEIEMENKEVLLIDFRKKEAYEKGHLPNAIHIWRTDIESTVFPYKGMMASKEEIEHLFSKKGIKATHKLIIYDDQGSCNAARLWWVLSSYGFQNMQLLNGGIQSWESIGGSLSTKKVKRELTSFRLPRQDGMQLYMDREALKEGLDVQANWHILDTRTYEEFSGRRKKNGAEKAGRIKKSAFMDWSNAVNFRGDMKFKSVDQLEAIYGKLIPLKTDTVITYCHTGVRSAHTTFVLRELLGYKHVLNYDESWVEWSYFKGYPFEKDSTTVILK